MIFEYNKLRILFQKMNDIGKSVTFSQFKSQNKSFLLRHDVDISLEKALEIAKIENEFGIVSTFFIMTTSDYYNVLTKRSKQLVNEIQNLNHEIGLHFDPTHYKDQYLDKVKCEASILSSIIGKPIKSVSLHNPSIHGEYPMFDGFVNAYDTKIFNDNVYVSDSCFDFRGKNIYSFIEGIDKNSIQILLHPIHYSKRGKTNYAPIFNKLLKNKYEELFLNFRENKSFKRETINGFSISKKIIKTK